MAKTKHTTVRIPEELRHELHRLATLNRRTDNAELIIALEAHVQRAGAQQPGKQAINPARPGKRS